MTYFIAFKLGEKLERAYSFIYDNDNVRLYKYLGKRNYNPYSEIYVAFTTSSQIIYDNNVPKIQFSNDVYIDGFKATFYAFKLLHKNESWWGLKPETIFEVIVQLHFKNTSDKPKYYIIFDDRPKYKHIYIIEPITKNEFIKTITEYEALTLWEFI
jgi:hypothetical protein